jgi:hypothetical protein
MSSPKEPTSASTEPKKEPAASVKVPASESTQPAKKEPAPIPIARSRNQKLRSKLKQVQDTSITMPPPQAVAAVPPPAPPAPEPVVLRQKRLKRSGHMHESLTAPLPEPTTPRDEPEY